MEGTKRRELAELRENIRAAVNDVARMSVGASPHEVRPPTFATTTTTDLRPATRSA